MAFTSTGLLTANPGRPSLPGIDFVLLSCRVLEGENRIDFAAFNYVWFQRKGRLRFRNTALQYIFACHLRFTFWF